MTTSKEAMTNKPWKLENAESIKVGDQVKGLGVVHAIEVTETGFNLGSIGRIVIQDDLKRSMNLPAGSVIPVIRKDLSSALDQAFQAADPTAKPYQEVPPGFVRLEHYNATVAEMNRQREQVTKQADEEIERLKAKLALAHVSGVTFDKLKNACEYFVGSLVADNRQNAAKEYQNTMAIMSDGHTASNRRFNTRRSRPSYLSAKTKWPSRDAGGSWRGVYRRQPAVE